MTITQENQENSASSQLHSVCLRLTVDQLRFIIARLDCSTDKEAAESIGISPDTVSYWKRVGIPIDEAIKLLAMDGLVLAQEIIRRSVPEAAAVKRAGLKSEDERIRQSVATELLDRGLGKPTQKQEISGQDGGDIVIHFTGNIRPDGV